MEDAAMNAFLRLMKDAFNYAKINRHSPYLSITLPK